MGKGKTGRYIKYAIGEIALVIIGILIALSINSWYSNWKLKSEEQDLLKDLRTEVNSNIEALKIVINEHEKSYAAGQEFKLLFQDRAAFNQMSDSTFRELFILMNQNWTYDPNKGILNSMISSGRINNLSNKELKYLLASLDDVIIDTFEETMKIESWRDDLITKQFIEAFIIVDGKIESFDIKSYYDSPTFRLLAFLFDELRLAGLDEENNLMNTMIHILELIDSEIN
jgi:Family of unknown function (DUF6090)